MKDYASFCLITACFISISGLQAQSIDDTSAACSEAARLITENDIDGALEEAQWCMEGLQQIKQNQTLAVFPDKVNGYRGAGIENQSAMGMTIIERQYQRDSDRIDVTLTTGSAGGGLAALAQMGLSLGASVGKKLRIQKRTVIDMSELEGQARYIVQLKSSGMLTISSSTVQPDAVLTFIKAFPIEELDDALKTR